MRCFADCSRGALAMPTPRASSNEPRKITAEYLTMRSKKLRPARDAPDVVERAFDPAQHGNGDEDEKHAAGQSQRAAPDAAADIIYEPVNPADQFLAPGRGA